jgi:hypothetical protein
MEAGTEDQGVQHETHGKANHECKGLARRKKTGTLQVGPVARQVARCFTYTLLRIGHLRRLSDQFAVAPADQVSQAMQSVEIIFNLDTLSYSERVSVPIR